MTALACGPLPDVCCSAGRVFGREPDTSAHSPSLASNRWPGVGCVRSSFLGGGTCELLKIRTVRENGKGFGRTVCAIKRGGGVRRRTREANPMEMQSKGPKMNEAVLAYPNIRLLDQDQKMIGIVASADALLAARNKDLDLVLIAGDADPPVCRIMDYTKYKYEKEKKARDSHKRAKANRVDQKELKMRYNTDTGDYNTTLRKCLRFLRSGDKVKFSMNFKAREMGFQKQGLSLFEKVQTDVGEWGVTEGSVSVEGRNIFLMLGPNKPYIERVKREEAKAGKIVEEDLSDDEDESEEQGDQEESDDEEDVQEEVQASNGAAVSSEDIPAVGSVPADVPASESAPADVPALASVPAESTTASVQ